MNIGDKELEALPREKLIEVIRMLSKNWHTLDGLWFRAVEEEFGYEAALKLDYKMWERGPVIESKRIKELFNLSGGGPSAVVKAINFMSWAPATGYSYEKLPGGRVIWTCTTCPPQDARKRQGLGENLCKPPGVFCFNAIAQAIDPAVKVNCYQNDLASFLKVEDLLYGSVVAAFRGIILNTSVKALTSLPANDAVIYSYPSAAELFHLAFR